MGKGKNGYGSKAPIMVLILQDVLAIAIADVAALFLRFELDWNIIPARYWETVIWYFPIHSILTILVFYFFRLYQSLWRFAGITEIQNLVAGSVTVSLAQMVVLQLLHWQVPRSFYFVQGMIFFLLVLINRFLYRFLRVKQNKRRKEEHGSCAILAGAGEAGHAIMEAIAQYNKQKIKICGIIDDDSKKWGSYVHGVEVVGGRECIRKLAGQFEVDEVIIAMPSAEKTVVRELYGICCEIGLPIRILPGVYQWVLGRSKDSNLRNIEISDLLGGTYASNCIEQTASYMEQKTILILGGSSFLGGELCQQLAAMHPAKLILMDLYENHAYQLQQELKEKYPNQDISVLVGFSYDSMRVQAIFKNNKPNVVYYVQPYKNEELAGQGIHEVVNQNVLGMWRCMEAARVYKAERFIMLSSEKAEEPESLLGACIKIGELLVKQWNQYQGTKYMAFRLGEILEDKNGILARIQRQITIEGKVRVPWPKKEIHFISLHGAITWVLEQSVQIEKGGIYPMEAGEAITMTELVKNLIQMSGLIPNEDICIECNTKLVNGKENLMGQKQYINGSSDTTLLAKMEYLQQIIDQEAEEVHKAVHLIVPEYHSI